MNKNLEELFEQHSWTDEELDFVISKLETILHHTDGLGAAYSIFRHSLILQCEMFKNMRALRHRSRT